MPLAWPLVNTTHGTAIVESTTLLQPEAAMPLFEDSVQAFSMVQGQACLGAAKTVHGLPLTGKAVHAFRCDTTTLGTLSAPEPLWGPVQALSAKNTAAVSTLMEEYSISLNVTPGST